jgi:chemotaxis protein MotB
VARKHKHPEHVNHERWLVSYADFITLLFAFFTTLYAISTVDAKKAGKLVFAMRAAFSLDFFTSENASLGGAPPKSFMPDVDDLSEPDILSPTAFQPREKLGREGKGKGSDSRGTRATGEGAGRGAGAGGAAAEKGGERPNAQQIAAQLQQMIGPAQIGRYIKLRHEPRGVVVSLEAIGFFDSGSARLRAEGLALLERIGRLLRDIGPPVRVEGHSDDQGSDAANWDLSAQRALALVRHWALRIAFPPKRLAAVGYGSHRPIAALGSGESRARNRRVDVVVLSPEAARDEPPN